MKNLIKITAAVFIIAIGIVAFNCTSTAGKDEAADSTAVSVDTVVVDTTKVSGGAGLEGDNTPQQ